MNASQLVNEFPDAADRLDVETIVENIEVIAQEGDAATLLEFVDDAFEWAVAHGNEAFAIGLACFEMRVKALIA